MYTPSLPAPDRGKPGQRVAYFLPKPRTRGSSCVLYLTPLEGLDWMAVLIPLPRRHSTGITGVLAPNAPLRVAVTARAGLVHNHASPNGDSMAQSSQHGDVAGLGRIPCVSIVCSHSLPAPLPRWGEAMT